MALIIVIRRMQIAYRQANPNWEEQQLESENYAKEWMESSARALEKSQNTQETSYEN